MITGENGKKWMIILQQGTAIVISVVLLTSQMVYYQLNLPCSAI